MKHYKVADHLFSIELSPEYNMEEILPSYTSFNIPESEANEDALFTLQCVPYGCLNLYSGVFNQSGDSDLGSWELSENKDHYIIDIEYYKGMPRHRMVCNKDFSNCQAAVLLEDPFGKAVLNSFISMAFSQSCTLKNTIIIHSSVIKLNGIGYAFLGKSGTGKSTHSQLWLSHIPGSTLLNDDNPAIRVFENGEIKIYGTPWSGKTPCYKAEEANLGGLVQLRQDKDNSIKVIKAIEAYFLLLASTSSIKDNKAINSAVGQTIEDIVNKVPCLYLKNKPDKEAAELCHNTLIQFNKKPPYQQ